MKTIQYLIDKIIDLKTDYILLKQENNTIKSNFLEAKQIICDLKLEINNLKLFLKDEEKNG